MKPSKGGTALPRLANQSAGRAKGPRNAAQRVSGHPCVVCGGSVVRSPRGPVPRACGACRGRIRDVRQLRAYFASAERLAQMLGLTEVADAARDALGIFDAERPT